MRCVSSPVFNALAAASGTALMIVGGIAIAVPKASGIVFGIPPADRSALAYVRAAGARDLIVGAGIIASLRDASALRRVLGLASLIGLADGILLAAERGPQWAHALHLGGFTAIAALACAIDE